MKIAVFGHPSVETATIIYNEEHGAGTTWVRRTEWVDVEFQPLPVPVVVEAQLGALDKAEADLRSQFQTKLDDLNTARANLRALTVLQ